MKDLAWQLLQIPLQQHGDTSSSTISQENGDGAGGNHAEVLQTGWDNESIIMQSGTENMANVSQSDQGNYSWVNQDGVGNMATVTQTGGAQ